MEEGDTEAITEALDFLPLHSEFLETGFRPYVLDLASLGLGGGEGALDLTIAVVVMMRQRGLLVALPELALAAEVLQPGMSAGPDALVGPSTKVEVRAAAMDEDTLQLPQMPEVGKLLTVLLVDFSMQTASAFKELTSEDLSLVTPFDLPEDHLVPWPEDIIARAFAWAAGTGEEEVAERIQFYSAEDVPETTPPQAPRRQPRRRTPGGGSGGGDPAVSAKKRPTVAQLAESLEALTAALPGITSKLQELSERTSAMETERSTAAPDRQSALRRPLGSSTMVGSVPKSSPSQLLKEMPPPRSSSAPTRAPKVSFAQDEVEELALDLPQGLDPLAQAMLMQSKAITALVSQLAANSGDPLQDLGSTSSSLSSRGAAGRARLQMELAAHKGVFFSSVLQSMARRMQPALPAEAEASALRDRGITPTQYLERFGGFGRTKDLGFIIWQVAMILNHMQEDNHLAAKDAAALLFVCLEQAAMDNGNLQVGLLLALTEDPPASLFSARSLAMGAHPRPFAPTANQRWITTALQYLKELDVISTRRTEVTGNKQATDGGSASSNAQPSNQPSTKKKPKGKGGGKNKGAAASTQPVEEEQ